METWKELKGFEDHYQISNNGRVKSLRYNKSKVLKQHLNSTGRYFFVGLWKDGKQYSRTVHSLMAETFLNHKRDGQFMVVDHIDNNQLNNNLSNLQIIKQRHNSLKDKKKPKSGFHGVVWSDSNNKWQVRPRVNGKKRFIGYFDCPKEANKRYLEFTNLIDSKKRTESEIIELTKYYKNKIKGFK